MIKDIHYFLSAFLFRPNSLFAHMRGHDMLRIAVALQVFRWVSTSLTTMLQLYLERSDMLFPIPFGIDFDTYRFLEIFTYGPYGLLIMTIMAYLLVVHGAPWAAQPMTFRKTWEMLGFCFFGPWLPSLFTDNILVNIGLGGPEILIPWHISIVFLECLLVMMGLQVVFAIPRKKAMELAAATGVAFLFLAAILIR